MKYETISKNLCEIEVQSGLINDKEFLVKHLKPLGNCFAIVADTIVAPLHGEKMLQMLSSMGLKTFLFTFPHGEKNKSRAVKEQIENQLFEKGLGRDTCLIALGGGVTTDLAGYVAATYARGIPLVMIPTTLLGMIDASIGGKTGVNVPYGKNLIGAIYQPRKILIDPSLLSTLPLKELKNGVVEMIKHGLIADKKLFDELERDFREILTLKIDMKEIIITNCRIKTAIVEQDEREGGKRNLLNLGHTLGHAIERLTDYTIPHGEAVAMGILAEAHIAVELGIFSQASWERIKSVFVLYELPLKLKQSFSFDEWMEAMKLDKKSLEGDPRFVILKEIGIPESFEGKYCSSVNKNLIKNALQETLDQCFV